MYAGGTVGRPAADFLVELHKRVQHPNPAFEHLFYRAVKDHVLADGRIDAEEAAWLRRVLFADGKIDDEERKFLHELKGEAGHGEPGVRGAVRGSDEDAAGAAHQRVAVTLLPACSAFPDRDRNRSEPCPPCRLPCCPSGSRTGPTSRRRPSRSRRCFSKPPGVNPKTVLQKLHTSKDGLSGEEAERRLQEYGPNVVAREDATPASGCWARP